MIEIYTQNIDGTWFAVAINKQQIITSSFGLNQKTPIEKILCNIPFNLPFQVFQEPVASAKNTLATLSCIYDGKEVDANLPLATSHLPSYTKKVLKITLAIPLGYVAGSTRRWLKTAPLWTIARRPVPAVPVAAAPRWSENTCR